MKKQIILSAAILLAGTANAELILEHASLNHGGFVKNVQVIPKDTSVELGDFYFSYDINKIAYNHEFKAAKHVIDQLPLSQQAKIYGFWTTALIEHKLDPNGVPAGNVALRDILDKSPLQTQYIQSIDDFNKFERLLYTDVTNRLIPVMIIDVKGNTLHFSINNHTGYNIKKVYGNLRIVEKSSNEQVLQLDLSKTTTVPKGKGAIFTIKMDSSDPHWANANLTELAYKFVVTGIEFAERDAFYPDQYYFEMKEKRDQLKSELY